MILHTATDCDDRKLRRYTAIYLFLGSTMVMTATAIFIHHWPLQSHVAFAQGQHLRNRSWAHVHELLRSVHLSRVVKTYVEKQLFSFDHDVVVDYFKILKSIQAVGFGFKQVGPT